MESNDNNFTQDSQLDSDYGFTHKRACLTEQKSVRFL